MTSTLSACRRATLRSCSTATTAFVAIVEPRIATHCDDFADGEREGDRKLLREYGTQPGDVASGKLGERSAVEFDAAGGRFDVAGERTEQRRLSGSVRADDGEKFAAFHLEGNVGEQGGAVAFDAEAPRAQHDRTRGDCVVHVRGDHPQPPSARRVVRRRTRKNGAPMSAVTTPSGNSAGARSVRAARSASIVTLAPSSAAVHKR